MVNVEKVWKSFGGNVVISGVSLDLERGEFVGLVGPSGSGKSVLLKMLGGVLPPDAGRILWNGSEDEDARAHVGFLFQEGALFDSMSVLENVMFPLVERCDMRGSDPARKPRSYSAAARAAFEILDEVGLSDAVYKMPGQLSGGMRRRVAIARALVCHPELVLMDDPTGGLDPVAASVIIALIKRLHQHYTPTIVLVSHDIRRLLPNVERVLALFQGRIVADMPPEALQREAQPSVLSFLEKRFDFSLLDSAVQ